MAYQVILRRTAEKELDRLPSKVNRRITTKLLSLESEPRPVGIQKLHGYDGYRVRVGDFRILYLIDDLKRTVEVLAIGDRRDVYR